MGEPEQPEEPIFIYDLVGDDFVARPEDDTRPTDEIPNLNVTWWTGMVGCSACRLGSYVVLPVLRTEQGKLRLKVPCPRCQDPGAVPDVYWYATADLVCPGCFHEFIKVFIDPIDILPDYVDCRRCGTPVNVYRDHAQDEPLD